MNIDNISTVLTDVQDNVAYIETIVNQTVDAYTANLDMLMKDINDNIVNVDNPALDTLERYFLELSNCLYFISDKSERVGLYEGVSKAAAQETFNQTYLNHQSSAVGQVGVKKPTVAESTAIAENESIYNTMVSEIYNRSYKIIKNKVDAAQTMVSTLSKIISRRMSEMQLTNMQSNKHILNEGGTTWDR